MPGDGKLRPFSRFCAGLLTLRARCARKRGAPQKYQSRGGGGGGGKERGEEGRKANG